MTKRCSPFVDEKQKNISTSAETRLVASMLIAKNNGISGEDYQKARGMSNEESILEAQIIDSLSIESLRQEQTTLVESIRAEAPKSGSKASSIKQQRAAQENRLNKTR